MPNTKRQYWKYSLLAIILIMGYIIFKECLPFLSGILGACTIYVLVRNQMNRLTLKLNCKKGVAAGIIIGEVILCFLVPAFLGIWLLINKVQDIDLNPSAWIGSIQHFSDLVTQKTGYNLLNGDNLSKVAMTATHILQVLLGQITSFIVNSIVMLFFLYFMLTGKDEMEKYIYDILPFSNDNKKQVVREVTRLTRANAIGIPLLAIIQGIIAMIGYMIFGVSDPVLFAFFTCFATIIPLIGTALVWLPLAISLALADNWFGAIGLTIYALVVISNIDNLVRFILQEKLAATHPLITVFGVIIGLTLFGFWGVIFGPLLLSMFFLCLNMFKIEYLNRM